MKDANTRILCVDDDSNLLAALKRQFHNQYEVFTAIGGEEGLNAIRESGPFAVMIVDQRMPSMSGVEFLKQARTVAPDTVAVMLTVIADLDLAVSALHEGRIYRFLNKPCSPEVLAGTLEDCVEQYRLIISERKLMQDLNRANQVLRTLNENLSKAREEAESANRTKSAFLANMSHEIRTPMTAILGYTELLVDVQLSDEEKSHAIEAIQRNSDHLMQLINDILDLSKIEAGKISVQQIEYSPCQLMSEVASLMRLRAMSRGLSFSLEYESPIPERIKTDPIRLRQILINLVGNAIKFTDSGSIRLVARIAEGEDGEPRLELDVVDTGIGLNEEQIGCLFQPFVQLESTAERMAGGTGLGLSISRRLAHLLGGDVSCSSEPGQGSTFRVSVPTGTLVGTRMLDNPSETMANLRSQATNAEHLQLSGRILLAEDGVDNQRLITLVLEKAGGQVTLAPNGKVAVELALAAWREGKPFDAILMDMQMPVVDGYTATRRLRREGYDGPVLALTAHTMAGDREKCVQAGCDELLPKPIDRKRLIGAVAEYSKKKAVVLIAPTGNSSTNGMSGVTIT